MVLKFVYVCHVGPHTHKLRHLGHQTCRRVTRVLKTCKGVFGSRFGFGLASQSLDSQV